MASAHRRTLAGMADAAPARPRDPRGRAGEEMALNDAYLNPQLGRIVRTLGFDKQWVAGEGAHLIDAEGNRYLDLLSATACSRSGATILRRSPPCATRWTRTPPTCPSSG